MARKRKTGFGSVLSSLPPDVRLGFAAGPNKSATDEPTSELLESTSIDDLIMQRVHVTQETQEVESVLAVEPEEPADDVEPTSPPPRKKQKISESSGATSTQSGPSNTPTITLDTPLDLATLHYKTQKKVPAHLKKCTSHRAPNIFIRYNCVS